MPAVKESPRATYRPTAMGTGAVEGEDGEDGEDGVAEDEASVAVQAAHSAKRPQKRRVTPLVRPRLSGGSDDRDSVVTHAGDMRVRRVALRSVSQRGADRAAPA